MSLPTRGSSYTFYVSLADASVTTRFLTSPTIEAGDVKVSKQGGALANIAALPTVANGQVAVVLSDAEMDVASVTVQFEDQTAPAEWLPLRVVVPTI